MLASLSKNLLDQHSSKIRKEDESNKLFLIDCSAGNDRFGFVKKKTNTEGENLEVTQYVYDVKYFIGFKVGNRLNRDSDEEQSLESRSSIQPTLNTYMFSLLVGAHLIDF